MQSAILDGELVLCDPRGAAHFYRLMVQLRTSHPNESQLMFLAFDLLHQDGVDLRRLPLSERKRDLNRLCRKAPVPFLSQVEQFPDGDILLDYCNRFGFEGVVSKQLISQYSSLFEKPPKPPAPTERERVLLKKREELARVQERLAARGLRLA